MGEAEGTARAWDRPKKDFAIWGKNDQYNGAATQVGNVKCGQYLSNDVLESSHKFYNSILLNILLIT